MAEIWENVDPNEGPKAYAAFVAYRGTPARDRSMQFCCEAYYGDKMTKSRPRTWERWSSQYNWRERCIAYDEHLNATRLERDLEARQAMVEVHLTESQLMQDVGTLSLQRTLAAMRAKEEMTLSPGLALQLVQQGSTMERLARGEPTDITGNAGAPVSWTEWLARQRADRGAPDRPSPFAETVAANGNGNGNGSNGTK